MTKNEKAELKKIYLALEQIHIPTSFSTTTGSNHPRRTGTLGQRDARQTSFGYIVPPGKKGMRPSRSTERYPHIFPMFKRFMKKHRPGFKFTTVYVNRNTIAKKHIDSRNAGVSVIVAAGPFRDGKTVIFPKDKTKKAFNIKESSLMFNGSEIEHSSSPYKNPPRYSFVFFNTKGKKK